MRAIGCAFLFVLGFAILAVSVAAGGGRDDSAAWQDKERAAIEKVLQNYMDTWNKHDLHALLMLHTEDVDFTNAFGTHYHGRAEMDKTFAPMIAGVYSATNQTGKIRSIRFLSHDVAAVDVDWEMTGAKNQDGSVRPTRKGLHSWVLTKQKGGSWLIAVMHVNEFTAQAPPQTPPAR